MAGAAALGYVVAAGVENMELLAAPSPGAEAGAIRAAYADRALVSVMAVAGVASLLLYVAFAASLAPRLARSRAALAAGIAGPALALAGIVASAPLVLDGGAGLSDADVRSAFELQRQLRLLAGPLMALFVVCLADLLPRMPARLARAVALPLALTPVLPYAVVAAAFGLHAICIWLASLWLVAGGPGVPGALLVRRAAFLMLVVAAGLVGCALLALPGATGAFFAWGLGPEPLAAFAGGVYVGSAVLFAAGLRAPWRQARALVAAAVVLSVSVLAITLLHLEPFDFGRLQAWAWVVLFAGFALTTSALLVAGGGASGRGARAASRRAASGGGASGRGGAIDDGARAASPGAVPGGGAIDHGALPRWARMLLAAAAAALTAVGAWLWIDPAGMPPLGGRFAGSWTVMLGFLAGWAAWANRRDEARLPALALVALPAGALAGALRTLDGDPAYGAGLAALVACGVAVARAARAR